MIPNADGPPRRHSPHGPLAAVLATELKHDPKNSRQKTYIEFVTACEYSSLKFMRRRTPEDIRGYYPEFDYACKRGCLARAQYLWSLLRRPTPDFVRRYDGGGAFQSTCANGHLEVAQWLWSLGIISMNTICGALRPACENGHLAVAQYLWSLGLDIENEYARQLFINTCEYGHLEVAQWLWSLGAPVDVHGHISCAFRCACARGHLKVAQWLWSLRLIPANVVSERKYEVLWCFSVTGYPEVEQWLSSLVSADSE
jgi:hypothetical protein